MTMTHKIVIASLLALSACDEEPLDFQDQGTYSDAGYATATVSGYAWDPEMFWLALASCMPPMDPACAPLVLPNLPIYVQSAVPGAAVGLFDPLQPMQTMPLPFNADELSALDGAFSIHNVPLRSLPPFFTVAAVPPGTPQNADGGLGANYFPTFNMKPIGTGRTTLCLSQPAGLVGDAGVLEAVAKYRSAQGQPTAATDFLDPTKFGGVAVFWLWSAGPGALKVPAFGASMKGDMGTTYTLSWLPFGVVPPIAPLQSKRGFYVNNDLGLGAPGAAPGVSVIVLPPLQGPPPMVTFTAADPVVDAPNGRPFSFLQLPPTQLAPGLITLGELQASSEGAGAPPDWVCLP